MIAILYGCSVPVVLRRNPDPKSLHYTFIGGCYIHGMMDGEAIDLQEQTQKEARQMEGQGVAGTTTTSQGKPPEQDSDFLSMESVFFELR